MRLPLVIPNRPLIIQFEKLASEILDSIKKLERQILLASEARDILLPRLMTGMIDVEELDGELPLTA